MAQRVSVLVCLFVASATLGLDLSKLQNALGGRNASWKAAENPITRLSPAERRRLLGVQLDENFDDGFFEAEPSRPKDRRKLPAFLDWRNHNGVRYASPILNQGRCGSCVAFAAVYQLETQMNITNATVFNAWEFSPQHLFSCGGGYCQRGWQPGSAVSFLKHEGIPDEACFPYESGALGDDVTCSKTCNDHATRTLKIVSHKSPTFFFASVDSIKRALEKGPVMTVFKVYEDFLYYESGIYKHVTGDVQGGHAVTIVGWNDSDRSWIVANSWGPSWGEKGFFRISWDDTSGLGRQTWAIEAPRLSGYVTPGDVRDGKILSGTVALAPRSTFPDTRRIEWKLAQYKRTLVRGTPSERLDTTQYPDGMYEIQAAAIHAAGTDLSHVRRVGILNGQLTGKLRFLNLQEGQTLTGKQVLEMEVSSEPVEFEEIEFFVEPLDGSGKPSSLTTTNVAGKMKLSWRTRKLDNGDYRVGLRGFAGNQRVEDSVIRVTIKN